MSNGGRGAAGGGVAVAGAGGASCTTMAVSAYDA
jgi:hypothetical protein